MVDFTNISRALGVPLTSVYLLLAALAVVVYIIYNQTPDKDKRKKVLWGTVAITLLLLGMSGAYLPEDEPPLIINENTPDWQSDYNFLAMEQLLTYNDDISNTPYYDYNHMTIVDIAEQIAAESSTSREAIEKTTRYVYENVRYIIGESDTSCFSGTAPVILEKGTGQCDTQSIVVISILRKMGIAAKPVGGCIFVNSNYRLQAILSQSFTDIFRAPQYDELANVDPDDTTFSRSVDYSRKGGLHAYLIAWTPEEGWIPVEATAGKIADTKVYTYHVELFPDDNKKDDICVSKNWYYAKACQTSNLELLDKYGLGVVTEVSP